MTVSLLYLGATSKYGTLAAAPVGTVDLFSLVPGDEPTAGIAVGDILLTVFRYRVVRGGIGSPRIATNITNVSQSAAAGWATHTIPDNALETERVEIHARIADGTADDYPTCQVATSAGTPGDPIGWDGAMTMMALHDDSGPFASLAPILLNHGTIDGASGGSQTNATAVVVGSTASFFFAFAYSMSHLGIPTLDTPNGFTEIFTENGVGAPDLEVAVNSFSSSGSKNLPVYGVDIPSPNSLGRMAGYFWVGDLFVVPEEPPPPPVDALQQVIFI